MAARTVSQKKWAKLVASTGSLSQPPGAVTRLSNLLFTQRGSLQIADGSSSIAQVSAISTIIEAIAPFSNLIPGQFPYYSALALNPAAQLTPPTNFTATPVVGTGTDNSPAYYFFGIVATLAGGHTDISSAQANFHSLLKFDSVSFTWTAVPGATGYSIYLYLAIGPPGSWPVVLLASVGAVTSYTFTGALPSGPMLTAPVGNTSYLLQLFTGTVSGGSLAFTAVTAGLFPSSIPLPVSVAPGDRAFNPSSPLPGYSPYGGLAGIACPIPQIVQFAGKVILILGNGYAPQATDPSLGATALVTPLANTFQDAYPTWQPSVDWVTGAQLTASSGGTNYLFTATQGGVSGSGSAPTWNFATGAETSDGSVVWTSSGPIAASVAPIGAAHAVAYAGSLWLANTWPTSTQYPSWAASNAFATGAQIVVPQAISTQWASGHSYSVGDQITVSLNSGGNTYYILFTVQTGGTSDSSVPSWDYQTGATTNDNGVIWVCGGEISTSKQIYYLFTAQAGGTTDSTAPSWDFTSDSTTTDNTVTWLNNGPIAAALCAGIDGPTCLKMSNANNPNSWNPVNVAFIGKDDGTQITGLQPFTIAALGISPTGSLCVFKEYTTYQVIGVFGSSAFEIQPAQTNLGCLAARSVQFIPGFGVVRFSHLGFAVFDGINDRLISEDIRPYLFGGVDAESDLTPVDPTFVYRSCSAQTVSPPMYLCAMPLSGQSGAITRLFCYDLVMKAWAVLDLPWAVNSLAAMAVGEGYPLVVAGKSDGTVQRLQSGDLTWDAGAEDQSNVAWSFRTPDVFGEGSSQRIFYEMATIRGYGSAAMVRSIVAKLWLDGQQIGPMQGIDIVPQGGSNLFEARVTIFRSGYRTHLDISGNNGGMAGVIDAVDWAVVPKSSLARRIIA